MGIPVFPQILKLTIGFFLLLTTALTEVKGEHPKNTQSKENYILILSSQQYKNPWSTSVAKKIQAYLEEENKNLITRTVYAGLDVQETMLASRLSMQKAFSHARLTPTIIVPRVLVLVDNESWMLYRIMNLRGLWEKVPVVLCGGHDKIMKDFSTFFSESSFADSLLIPVPQSTKHLSVTGVFRNNNDHKAFNVVKSICPGVKEIVFISNGGYGDEYTWWQKESYFLNLRPKIKVSYFNTRQTSEENIRNYVNALSADSAALIFNSYPTFLPSLKLPSFSLRDGGAENDHITGGLYASTDQFARQTARMIIQLYNGKKAQDIPFEYAEDVRFYLNKQSKFVHGAHSQPRALPMVSYYNVPPFMTSEHIRIGVTVLVLLTVIVISVLAYIRNRKYRKHIQEMLGRYQVLHERFQVIYDEMPLGLLIFDENGKLLQQNKADRIFQELWVGEGVIELNTLFKDPKIQNKISAHENVNQVLILHNGKFLTRPTEQDGDDCHYYRLIVRYVPDENSSQDHILVMLIDNTDIYRERIINKRIRNVFNFAMNKAEIGVSEYNPYTLTGSATNSWCKHLGLPLKFPHPYLSAFRNVAEQDRQEIVHFYNNACLGKSAFFSKDIKVVYEDCSSHYLRQQIKVTEYQPENMQMWIVELNQNIDAERKFAAQIEAAILKAQEAERLKNTFIANMSHEIRSPLNALIGFSNLIATTTDIEVRQEMIHYIEESNEALLRQVNDIIDLSKIESGSMTFTISEINFNGLLRDITAMFQIRASQKRLSVVCNCPQEELYILTDKFRVRQVISNFMSNAVKYSEEGEITLGYELEGDELYVYVKDSGVGIPEEQVDMVFSRFFRIAHNKQGYGLGLAISQAIVEGLNGRIGAISKVGVGSTFWFRLPLEIIKSVNRSTSVSGEFILQEDSRAMMPQVLIAEENNDHFLLCQLILKDCFRISYARNKGEIMKLCQEQTPDLILMDVGILYRDEQIIQKIHCLSPELPLIAMLEAGSSEEESVITDKGFCACLRKPLEKRVLLDSIDYWLNPKS